MIHIFDRIGGNKWAILVIDALGNRPMRFNEVLRSIADRRNIPPDHAFYGVPWPGEYLLAPDGTVRDKVFLPIYEHRASATAVIFRNCGVDNTGHGVEIKTTVVDASVTLSSDRCFAGQELGIALDLNVKPGWHLYGKPLPSNYRPTELVLSGPLVDHLTLELPAPQTKLMKTLDETLPVYEGKVSAVGKLAIKWSPPIPAPFLLKIGPANRSRSP
ncbi:MAG: hypothetical protein ACLQBA_14980 [Candidatus Binataceae bacterium]